MSDFHKNWMDVPIHILDFEGNGYSGVVEFGLATVKGGEIVEARSEFCKPQGRIPRREMELHGIANEDVADAEPLKAHWDYFIGLRQCGPLGAHHASVEENLLKRTWSHPRMAPDFLHPGQSIAEWGPWLDTKELYANLFPKLESYGLGKLISTFDLLPQVEELAGRFCPPSRRQFHAALFDAIASAVLLLNLASYPELTSHITLPWLLTQSLSGSAKKQEALQAKLF